VIPEQLNLLHWTGSDIARASNFQFFSTGFTHSWFIYLFSPFTFSYLHPSFVYSYSYVFSSFIRQLLIPFSLYSSRCFVLRLLIHSFGFGIKLRPVAEFNFQDQTKHNNIKSEVFIAVRVWVLVLTPCSLIGGYQYHSIFKV